MAESPEPLNIGLLLEAVADAVPEREAIVWRARRRLTFAQLLDRCRRLASVLAAAGLGAHDGRPEPWEAGQDLALLYMTNCPEYLEGMIGSYLARVGPANVNYRYTVDEIAHLVADSNARAAVVHARYAPTLVEAAQQAGRTIGLLLVVDDGSGTPLPPGATSYEDTLAAADPSPRSRDTPTPDDLYVVYTGGTTGMPKGVLWRQDDFLAGALGVRGTYDGLAAFAKGFDATRLRTVPAPPLMHGAAHWNALSCLLGGGTVVLPAHPDRVDWPDLLDTIEAERCTSLNMVGDAFAMPMLDAQLADPRDLSSLRYVISGGAVLSATTKDRLVEAIPGLQIVDIVGSSESGRQGMARGTGPARFDRSASSLVLTDDRTAPLEPGTDELGWLATTGPIPRGYLNDPDKTAATFPTVDGVRYVIAGDRARLRADGSVELLGRESVTINTGGEKVFAEEVEEAVKAHPAVLDCIVVGRPHERFGQEVVAVVQLRTATAVTDAELKDAAAATLARYKLPRAFVRVDAVQRTASGKADYAWARSVATTP